MCLCNKKNDVSNVVTPAQKPKQKNLTLKNNNTLVKNKIVKTKQNKIKKQNQKKNTSAKTTQNKAMKPIQQIQNKSTKK